jgi:hypothetical protein
METEKKMLFQKNNLPERYIPLEHTHRYIVEKSKQYSLLQIAEAMGWTKLQKLRWRRQKWDNLQQHIPKRYLDAIGVDYEELLLCNQTDCDLFHLYRQQEFTPKSGAIRLLPAVYKSVPFTEGTDEAGAICLVREALKTYGTSGIVSFPGIKIILINKDGSTSTSYHEPKISFDANRLLIPHLGVSIGTMGIRR